MLKRKVQSNIIIEIVKWYMLKLGLFFTVLTAIVSYTINLYLAFFVLFICLVYIVLIVLKMEDIMKLAIENKHS